VHPERDVALRESIVLQIDAWIWQQHSELDVSVRTCGRFVQALLRSGVLRDDIFITTKIHPQDLGYQPTLAAFENSLKSFSTDFIDLVLLHYAACFGSLCSSEPKGTWRDSWRALEDLVREGRVLAIGACLDACLLHDVHVMHPGPVHSCGDVKEKLSRGSAWIAAVHPCTCPAFRLVLPSG
jgi:hypothetical protein